MTRPTDDEPLPGSGPMRASDAVGLFQALDDAEIRAEDVTLLKKGIADKAKDAGIPKDMLAFVQKCRKLPVLEAQAKKRALDWLWEVAGLDAQGDLIDVTLAKAMDEKRAGAAQH
jgi:hypothetical protein